MIHMSRNEGRTSHQTVFYHEFQTKRFYVGKSIIRRSSMAAIFYQNKPLSPVSLFNYRDGLLVDYLAGVYSK